MKEQNYYSKAFKLRVIEEVLRGEITKEEACRKYSLKGKSAVLSWMRKFGMSQYSYVPNQLLDMKKKENLDSEQMKKRIKELERALEDAKLKDEGYSRMLDIAEKEYKIRIRKKSSTKQSGK